MGHEDAILTEELCDEIISEVLDSMEYQIASSFLEEEIMKLHGENEFAWARHNDAYVALENLVARKAFEIGYAHGKADKQSVEVATAAL
jgi:hypothetical protein